MNLSVSQPKPLQAPWLGILEIFFPKSESQRILKDKGYEVTKDWERMVYSVQGPRIDELMRYYNENSEESIMRVTRTLKKIGVEEELKKIGCQNGDIVRIGTIEFEFND